MVGQIVTGVVQATFDGGYFIAVKIGNSSIPLTGAVFKPGHVAPITPENDVAPHVEVIKRPGIPIPADIQPTPPRPNNGLSSTVLQAGSRGTVVPVVLQPKHLSNNIPKQYIQEPTCTSFAGLTKQAGALSSAIGSYPPNGSISQPSYFPSSSQFGDMNEPLFVEPLQTRHPVQHFQPSPVFGGVPHGGTGRMTDLLNAVQRGVDQVANTNVIEKVIRREIDGSSVT
ncbi:protein METABOLIC NETWORK MODULATOR 1-like, partial [Bidens hawaiensis]|uniref:protein METABOLIC NETWORK MODULATOR 1-like n=1 Tax=Bidens hawaiensis TaxID=980011 RepID=UPI00404AF73C